MSAYNRVNNLTGWIVFLIATITYLLTVEPTASFWDSGEYIAASYTLGVPHAPGAPLYLLVGRLFSFLSLGNPLQVALCLNVLSALCSSLAVLFLFWSITLVGRKLLHIERGIETPQQMVLLMGSGVVGALAFAFSDSFWFSATETELYAVASFFTAFCFWAMLKWESIENSAKANRWLLLIAYMIGLSVGVHILNLLVIPALALIYYYKKNATFSVIRSLLAFTVGGIILLLVMYGLGLSGSIAASLDIFFVNVLSLPFGSGILFFVLIFFGTLGYGIYYSHQRRKVSLNSAFLLTAFVFIGYTSYLVIPIRAKQETAINLNDPNHIVSFIGYLNREQYPSRPLWYGPDFTAKIIKQEPGKTVYDQGEEEYVVKDHQIENIYDPKAEAILPRMYSRDPGHAELYRQWTGMRAGEKPTFAHNLTFLFRYQLGHMYLRYFMWNFAGREGNRQNAGWLSPTEALQKVPSMIREDKARNNYWMLPLLLGVGGLIFQYQRSKKGFTILAALFFMTGIALVLYSNNPPIEPRERDYVYVSNFYTFAFWIGMGVIALVSQLQRVFKSKNVWQPAVASLVCLSVPLLMISENWDDHDRTDRYFSVDAARNMLASCDENAILFTGGDNDTYPLWYVQHVEGFRTDVRVLVAAFANVDWYIKQMRRPLYESRPLPLSLTMKHYQQGALNDYIPFVQNPNINGAINASQYLKLIENNSQALQANTSFGKINTIPSKAVYFNIDTAQVVQDNIVPPGKESLVSKRIAWELTGSGLEKKDLLLLDLVDTSRWKRPIYFNNTSLQSMGFDLNRFVVQEGDTFRLTPLKNPDEDKTMVDTEKMYGRMMHQFAWRGMDDPEGYYHGYYLMYAQSQRMNFNTLAEALVAEGSYDKAKNALHKSLQVMPDDTIPYDVASVKTAGLLLGLGEKDKADHIADTLSRRYDELLTYMAEHEALLYERDQTIGLYALNQFAYYYGEAGYLKEAEKFQKIFLKHYQRLEQNS